MMHIWYQVQILYYLGNSIVENFFPPQRQTQLDWDGFFRVITALHLGNKNEKKNVFSFKHQEIWRWFLFAESDDSIL